MSWPVMLGFLPPLGLLVAVALVRFLPDDEQHSEGRKE